MILDATAGNRLLWLVKKSDNIVYLDRQTRLQVKPTIFADNTQTPFMPKCFDTIIFDPPHDIGGGDGFFSHPNAEEYNKIYSHKRDTPTYYGAEIFNSKTQLIKYIYHAQEEFKRILKDDGLLIVKWCDIQLTLNRFIIIFLDWTLLMQIRADQPTHTFKQNKTYWLYMEKRKANNKQVTL